VPGGSSDPTGKTVVTRGDLKITPSQKQIPLPMKAANKPRLAGLSFPPNCVYSPEVLHTNLAGEFTAMEDKKIALKMVINGKEKDVSYEELALSNNLAQEALVRLLIEKGLFKPDEMLKMMETVKKERYRFPRKK